jgi:hypothetical protein
MHGLSGESLAKLASSGQDWTASFAPEIKVNLQLSASRFSVSHIFMGQGGLVLERHTQAGARFGPLVTEPAIQTHPIAGSSFTVLKDPVIFGRDVCTGKWPWWDIRNREKSHRNFQFLLSK